MMGDRIKKAARVMARAYFGEPLETEDLDQAIEWAEALDRAGMLVTPLDGEVGREMIGIPADQVHEEWSCRYTRRGETVYRGDGSEVDARGWAVDQGDQIIRRYVTSLEAVE